MMMSDVKDRLPKAVLLLLQIPYRYVLGLWYWLQVLGTVRGDGPVEQIKILLSALVAPVTNLARLRKWQYPCLLFDVRVIVPNVGKFFCRARSDQLFQIIPAGQQGVRKVLETKLTPGSTFVDAGANVGFFTVLASRIVGENGRVISIEMIPETAQLLRKHVAINMLRNVTIVEAALSEVPGEELVARLPKGRGGQATLSTPAGASSEYQEEYSVLTTTLDEVTKSLERIDVLKIDVEGHEAMVFRGGPQSLKKTTAVVFEVWSDDPRSEEAVKLLRDAGLIISDLDIANKLAERV